MNIPTRNKIVPIAKRMVRGVHPTEIEIRLFRDAATDVQDQQFKALLQTAGNETTLHLRRQTGRELLNKVRFATGSRRKNDLPPDNPRPEKVKRWLKGDKLVSSLLLIALCTSALLLTGGCATTQYEQVEVSKLTDQQLVEELASVERELGIESDSRGALLSIDTSPRPVVTSAITTYSGNFNAQNNNANRNLYGSFNGSGYTTYQYADPNAGPRFVQTLALIINASNSAKLESRRKAVLTEISRRHDARENMERVTGEFLTAHPEIAANKDLLIACLLITQTRTNDTLEQLQQAAEIMHELPSNRWIGWVEAHGIPGYPYGVVVGSYAMDLAWDGDTLTGKGKGSDGFEMILTAKKQQDGTLRGGVRSEVMEAKFSGRMNDAGLCMDYTGTNSGHPIRGITWAFRRAE